MQVIMPFGWYNNIYLIFDISSNNIQLIKCYKW